MTEPLNLSIEALSASHAGALISAVEKATLNSIGKVVDIKHISEDAIRFSIQITADKLDQLSYALLNCNLSLKHGAEDVLQNVANQYSLYRDVNLNLLVGFF